MYGNIVKKGKNGYLIHIDNELVVPFLNVGWMNFNLSELVHPHESAVRVFVLVELSKVVLATFKLRGNGEFWFFICFWPVPVGQNIYRKLNTVLSLVPLIDFFILGLHIPA